MERSAGGEGKKRRKKGKRKYNADSKNRVGHRARWPEGLDRERGQGVPSNLRVTKNVGGKEKKKRKESTWEEKGKGFQGIITPPTVVTLRERKKKGKDGYLGPRSASLSFFL